MIHCRVPKQTKFNIESSGSPRSALAPITVQLLAHSQNLRNKIAVPQWMLYDLRH